MSQKHAAVTWCNVVPVVPPYPTFLVSGKQLSSVPSCFLLSSHTLMSRTLVYIYAARDPFSSFQSEVGGPKVTEYDGGHIVMLI
jgi:hypothetical protein